MSTSTLWRLAGATVRGSLHIREGLPRQDAISWRPDDGTAAARVIVAVADGHGNAASFRSDIGAEFAVQASLRIQQEACERYGHEPSRMKEYLESQFATALVGAWRLMVTDDLQSHPFLDDEIKRLAPQEKKMVDGNNYYAYGSTILTVVIDSTYMAFSQLGDGDITYVVDTGDAGLLFPANKELVGGSCESLCLDDAAKRFRTRFQVLSGRPPALVLLTTDGYKKSYDSEEEFLQVGKDILSMLKKEGIGVVSSQLEGWLNSTSSDGSGDDITLGIICRDDLLREGNQSKAPHPSSSDALRDDFFATFTSSTLTTHEK